MATDSLVSILMPAYKTEFLREALGSVLNQTHGEIEVLIGDNSGHPLVRDIVEEFADARVHYVPSHLVTQGSVHINHMLLWWRARGRYVRYVYDDDVAYPRSTEVLLKLLQAQPACVMAWHQRDVIDAESRVLGRQNYLGDNATVVMDRSQLLTNLAQMMNFVGEPSFAMFDKTLHTGFNFCQYEGFEFRFLWDVAMYLGAGHRGLLTGSSEFLGGFRRHDAQISAALNKNFVFGCVEWEVVFRNEFVRGHLSEDSVYSVLPRLAGLYHNYEQDVPALAPFRVRLLADLAAHRVAEATAAFNLAYRELAKTSSTLK